MNLKLRFALLFTFFVATILTISSATIYILYANYRQEDYFRRVSSEGQEVYNIITALKGKEKEISAQLIRDLHDRALFSERIQVLDSTGALVFKLPDTANTINERSLLNKIKQNKTYYFREDMREHVGLYIDSTRSYMLASGIDRSGFRKLHNLRVILTAVFIGALVITGIFSFVFVRQAIKPLARLSTQMRYTNEQNLTVRVPASEEKDEINTIARNFNAMLERLQNAFAFQKNFVHHASHELRTPLASMLSQTESALNKTLDAEGYKQVLVSLKDDQQRLIELTNSLLMISQYDQIAFRKDWPELRIDELLYETVVSSKKMFPDLSVNINFTRPPVTDRDFIVYGNDALLKSAFGNLVKNAYAYSYDRKLTISIDVYHHTLQLHFDNNGKQLSPKEARKVMVAFFRGENAGESKGFGLGLSIVQRIISIHQGSFSYVPLYDDLNRFTITLPKAGAPRKNKKPTTQA